MFGCGKHLLQIVHLTHFFKKEPNETCSKKRAKRQAFNFTLDKLTNHSSEGKGEEKWKERGEEKGQW